MIDGEQGNNNNTNVSYGEIYEMTTSEKWKRQLGAGGEPPQEDLVLARNISRQLADKLNQETEPNRADWNGVTGVVETVCRRLDGGEPTLVAEVIQPLVGAVLNRADWLDTNYSDFNGDVSTYVGDMITDASDQSTFQALRAKLPGLRNRSNRE